MKLPSSVWALVRAALDYGSCKSLEACSRGFYRLVRKVIVVDPKVARLRFKETHADKKELVDIFRQVDCHGIAASARLKLHPLFACVDWQRTASFAQLMVVRNSAGQKLARPIALASQQALHESATSPAVADAVLRVSLADATAPSPPCDFMTPGSKVVSVGDVFRAWSAIARTK